MLSSLVFFRVRTYAFDYLNRDLLLHQLDLYGFRGQALLILRAYLSSRWQYVSINGHFSDTKPILSGVPPGGIPGPFLFSVSINDIVNINELAKFVIYADDTTLLFSAVHEEELFAVANKTLQDVSM